MKKSRLTQASTALVAILLLSSCAQDRCLQNHPWTFLSNLDSKKIASPEKDHGSEAAVYLFYRRVERQISRTTFLIQQTLSPLFQGKAIVHHSLASQSKLYLQEQEASWMSVITDSATQYPQTWKNYEAATESQANSIVDLGENQDCTNFQIQLGEESYEPYNSQIGLEFEPIQIQ